MIRMTNLRKLEEELKQLNDSLNETVQSWRIGNDHNGLQYFIKSIQHLDNIVNSFYIRNGNNIVLKELFQILKQLEQYLINRDVIGITDSLEFQLIPFIQKWDKEVKTIDNKS